MGSRIIKIYGITILFSILVLGCGNKNPEEISSMIRVSYPVSQEVPLGLGLEIELTNESKYCVIFPQVTGMAIYTMQDGKEIEVNNLIVIMGSENMPLEPRDEIFSKRSIDVVPDTSNLSITSPTQFFVRLNGYLCDDESIKIVKIIPFTVVP